MDERLERLEDILKSCQLSRTADPVETNQTLPTQCDIIFNECGMNGHEPLECSLSHNISTCGASQLINSVLRNSFSYHETEDINGMGVNTFQTRTIRGNF